ncbi:hypothetical protein IP023_11755 [Sphingobacterium rhinopitheci]|nr:hypothetical protein [Sphingobacterium rhinopitheci]
MHLKNFSMVKEHHLGWVLSAAYDLLNVKIILPPGSQRVIKIGKRSILFKKTYPDVL